MTDDDRERLQQVIDALGAAIVVAAMPSGSLGQISDHIKAAKDAIGKRPNDYKLFTGIVRESDQTEDPPDAMVLGAARYWVEGHEVTKAIFDAYIGATERK